MALLHHNCLVDIGACVARPRHKPSS
jgi:hypothetical protein